MHSDEPELASNSDQTDASTFDYAAWMRQVDTICQQIRASKGNELLSIDVVGILRDIRDGEDE